MIYEKDIWKDDSFEEYLANKDYLAKSDLAKILKSPADFQHARKFPGAISKSTKALQLGTHTHSLLMTPALAEEAERLWGTVKKDSGIEKLNAMDIAHATLMAEYCLKHPFVAKYMAGPLVCERSFYAYCPKLKRRLRCRVDMARPNDWLVVDLKTTSSVEENDFSRDCLKFSYPLSVAVTSRAIELVTGVKPKSYLFLTVQTSGNPHVRLFSPSQEFRDYGEFLLHEAVKKLDECEESGVWPIDENGDVAELKLHGSAKYSKRWKDFQEYRGEA